MAFVNLPPNLQDMFGSITDRIAKLETGPNQAMYVAESAQATSSQGLAEAEAAYALGVQAQNEATQALIQAQASYSLSSQSLIKSANTITNAQNQITGINGNGITVYSGGSSSSGARVVLNSAGLVGYNSGNSPTFTLDASSGNVSMSGALFSNGQISGGSLNINGNAIIDSSGFLTAYGATINGTITSNAATITGGSLIVGSQFQVNTSGVLTASNAFISGNITATSGTFTGTIYASNGTIGGWSMNGTKLYSGTSEMNASTGNAIFNGVTAFGQIYGYSSLQVNTTGQFLGNLTASAYLINSGIAIQNGTAVHILSGGRLVQSTSSERFKKNITTIPEGGWLDKVVQIRPVNFQYDEAYCEAPDEIISGLIAEDIADIDGFEHLIVTDPLGDPYSVGYDRLTVFLVLAIKELKAKIDKLEGN